MKIEGYYNEKRKSKRINRRPAPEFELEDFMEKLVFIEKVEKGLIQLDEKKTLDNQVVKEKVEGWQK